MVEAEVRGSVILAVHVGEKRPEHGLVAVNAQKTVGGLCLCQWFGSECTVRPNILNDVRCVAVGGVGDYQCLVLEIFEIVHKSIGLNCETIKLIALRR